MSAPVTPRPLTKSMYRARMLRREAARDRIARAGWNAVLVEVRAMRGAMDRIADAFVDAVQAYTTDAARRK